MEYVDIPLGDSDYFRRTAGNPPIQTKNVYFEEDPTNQNTQVSLVRRPGLRLLMTVGDGPIRKIYYRPDAFDNDFFVISNDTLYRVTRTGDDTFSTTALTGTLASGTITITASGNKLFLSDQTTLYYTDGTAPLTAISTPDGVIISRVAYISGYIICVEKDSQRFFWINPGEVTIDSLNFAEAEGLPDGIVDILILGDQMYLFGKETIEIWYLSGDSSAPFQRVQGKLMNIGALANTSCVVSGNDTFFFIAADGTARLGPNAQRVSHSGIEERFRRAIADMNLANI